MTEETTAQGYIMLVDDIPANLKLLEAILKGWGHNVRCFQRGRPALAAAAAEPPDLVLLDINMPDMDGFEVCTQLKANPALAKTPVIFVSGLNEAMDKVKAFGCGAVDYVTKPFDISEAYARIETHLKLHRLQKELEEHNARLDEMVAVRSRQLAEAHARLSILDKAKSDFLLLISHELRTPLQGLFGVAEILFSELPETPTNADLQACFEKARRRLLTIIEDALLLTQIEVDAQKFASNPIPIVPILRLAAANTASLAASRNVQIESIPGETYMVYGDMKLTLKAVQALLDTAIKFSGVGKSVRLALKAEESRVVLTIDSTGKSIPEAALPKFFQVLSVVDAIAPGGDLGLAPPVAERILSLFGGSVTVENTIPAGIRLTIRFQAD